MKLNGYMSIIFIYFKVNTVNIGSIYDFNILQWQPESEQMSTLCSKQHFFFRSVIKKECEAFDLFLKSGANDTKKISKTCLHFLTMIWRAN